MVIYCDNEGRVSSIPSTVPFGAIINDLVIIAPHPGTQAILKINPPSRKRMQPIYCTPQLNTEKDVVYNAKLPKTVTNTAGRAEYQLEFTSPDGETYPSLMGSFYVARGVELDVPPSADSLGQYTLEDLHMLLTSISARYLELADFYSKVQADGEELAIGGTVYDAIQILLNNIDTLGEGLSATDTKAQTLDKRITDITTEFHTNIERLDERLDEQSIAIEEAKKTAADELTKAVRALTGNIDNVYEKYDPEITQIANLVRLVGNPEDLKVPVANIVEALNYFYERQPHLDAPKIVFEYYTTSTTTPH